MENVFGDAIVVAVDGLDGCGKTSLAEYIAAETRKLNQVSLFNLPRAPKVLVLHMFGHDEYSMRFRSNLAAGNYAFVQIALGALHHSSLNLHQNVPVLCKDYDVIILDRGRASFYAYQIVAEKQQWIATAFDNLMDYERKNGLCPEYIYLRSSVKRSMKMIAKREGKQEYHDLQPIDFKERLYKGYEKFFLTPFYVDPEGVMVIDVDTIDAKHGRDLETFLVEGYGRFLTKYQDRIISRVRRSHYDKVRSTPAQVVNDSNIIKEKVLCTDMKSSSI